MVVGLALRFALGCVREAPGPLCSDRRGDPMRAVVTEDYGSGPTLSDVSRPEPGPGEIRVKVLCSSLNGFDIAMAAGYLKGLMEHRFPAVLGRDFAGTVDEVGAGVTAFAPGDDVFGVVLTQPLTAGAFADYVVMPEDHNVAR